MRSTGHEPGSEPPVGDADARVGTPTASAIASSRVASPVVTSEVAGRASRREREHPGRSRTTAGVIDSVARATASNRACFGGGVAIDHDETGATRLGLPPPQPDGHAGGPCLVRRGADDEPACAALHHGHRHIHESPVVAPRDAHRPGRAPEGKRALRLHVDQPDARAPRAADARRGPALPPSRAERAP